MLPQATSLLSARSPIPPPMSSSCTLGCSNERDERLTKRWNTKNDWPAPAILHLGFTVSANQLSVFLMAARGERFAAATLRCYEALPVFGKPYASTNGVQWTVLAGFVLAGSNDDSWTCVALGCV